MRVLLTTDYYPPHYGGGAEATLPVVVQALASRGHEVEVITLNTRKVSPVEERDGATVYRVPTVPLERLVGLQFSLSPSLPAFVSKRVRRFRPDIIWAHNHFFTTALAAHWASSRTGTPVMTDLSVADANGLPASKKMLAVGWEKTLSRWMLRRSVVLTGVSQACIDHGLEVAGRRAIDAVVVPNGVDTRLFHPAKIPPETFTVGFVGRLIYNKGPQRLLEAAPRVLGEHSGAKFVFIGDGPLRSTLEARARELGVSHAVEFRGPMSHEEIPEALRSLSVVVRPSDTEGMPVIVLESMATGLPMIATDVGGTREVLKHGETGLLLPPGPSPEDISSAINYLAADRQRLAALGWTAREASEELDWQHCVGLREDVLMQYGRVSRNGTAH